MVRAAARQGIDFERANLLGRWWWLRLNWLLNETEAQAERDLISMYHAQHMAVLSYTNTPRAFKHHWKESEKQIRLMFNSLYPWLAEKVEEQEGNEVVKLSQRWKETFGDPESPVVKQQIDATVKSWREIVRESEIKVYGNPVSRYDD